MAGKASVALDEISVNAALAKCRTSLACEADWITGKAFINGQVLKVV